MSAKTTLHKACCPNKDCAVIIVAVLEYAHETAMGIKAFMLIGGSRRCKRVGLSGFAVKLLKMVLTNSMWSAVTPHLAVA